MKTGTSSLFVINYDQAATFSVWITMWLNFVQLLRKNKKESMVSSYDFKYKQKPKIVFKKSGE